MNFDATAATKLTVPQRSKVQIAHTELCPYQSINIDSTGRRNLWVATA